MAVHEWENEFGETLVYDDDDWVLTHSDAESETPYTVPKALAIDGLILNWREVKTLAEIIVARDKIREAFEE